MELFHRDKRYKVTLDPGGTALQVAVDMEDRFHDMGVRVRVSYPDLVIRQVTPRMDRTPYPVCPNALERAQGCVGLKVQGGLALMLNRSVGGPEGCSHMTQLLLDACHAAIQGLLALQTGAGGERIPPEEKVRFLDDRGLSTRDSCTAYATARRGDA